MVRGSAGGRSTAAPRKPLPQTGAVQAVRQEVLRVLVDDGSRIPVHHEGDVGVRRIDDELDRRLPARCDPSGEVVGDAHRQGDIAPIDHTSQLIFVGDRAAQAEVLGGAKAGYEGPALGRSVLVENRGRQVSHIEVDGVAVHHELYQGRTEEEEPQPAVAPHLNELLAQDVPDTP